MGGITVIQIMDLRIVPSACVLIFAPTMKQFVKKVCATVISKEVKSGTHETGRSVMGYSFAVTFQTEDDQILELFTYEIEYGGLKIGTKGVLTYQGRYFVDFK